VKYLLEKLQSICNELKNEDEIAIIKTYGKNSKQFTLLVSCKKIFTDISYTIGNKINYNDIHYTIIN